MDDRVRECAPLLEDEKLLAKLSGGNLVALEAKYHTRYLAMLYRRAQYAKDKVGESEQPHRLDGIALAELVSYIEELRTSGVEVPITFKLADLATMYTSCLQRLGYDTTVRVNTSHFLKSAFCSKFQIPCRFCIAESPRKRLR